jgi:CheY-like chemotaxis protein
MQPVPIEVLIVDDDPDYLELLENEISQIDGVHAFTAHSPQEAVQLLSQRDFDLVVSDWALDSWTAPDVLLRADAMMDESGHNKVPVLFISGSEKVSQTQVLRSLRHFEPVSFVLKRCGPPLIGIVAGHLLTHFCPNGPGAAC